MPLYHDTTSLILNTYKFINYSSKIQFIQIEVFQRIFLFGLRNSKCTLSLKILKMKTIKYVQYIFVIKMFYFFHLKLYTDIFSKTLIIFEIMSVLRKINHTCYSLVVALFNTNSIMHSHHCTSYSSFDK